MTAPIRNSIELNTVGELHFVLFVEPAALFVSFRPSSGFTVCGVSTSLDRRIIDKFKLFALVGAAACVGAAAVLVLL